MSLLLWISCSALVCEVNTPCKVIYWIPVLLTVCSVFLCEMTTTARTTTMTIDACPVLLTFICMKWSRHAVKEQGLYEPSLVDAMLRVWENSPCFAILLVPCSCYLCCLWYISDVLATNVRSQSLVLAVSLPYGFISLFCKGRIWLSLFFFPF